MELCKEGIGRVRTLKRMTPVQGIGERVRQVEHFELRTVHSDNCGMRRSAEV
jgi:hypothetical protein